MSIPSPALAELIETLASRAKDGQLPLSEAQAEVARLTTHKPKISEGTEGEDVELDDVETEDEIEIGALLEGLSAVGVEVVDDFDEGDLTEAAKKAESFLASRGEPAELDSYSQWRREAAHHTVLSPADEREMATRMVFLRKSAEALARSLKRFSDEKIEPMRVQIARGEEIIAMLAEDPESKALIAAQEAELAPVRAELAELESKADDLAFEQKAAKWKWLQTEGDFMSHNYRLVIYWAMKRYERFRRAELMELISQGNEGMLNAARKFDPLRGFKFSTFACFHIRQKITEYTDEQTNAIKVPTHRRRDARRIGRIHGEYLKNEGREASIEELASALGKTEKKILEILDAEAKGSTASLDKPVSSEGDSATLGELIADAGARSPEDMAELRALGSGLTLAMEETLNARERRVLQLRFGMYDEVPQTLEWIGKRMSITRERVRQIEAKALEKLRKHSVVREMRGADEPGVIRAREMLGRSVA